MLGSTLKYISAGVTLALALGAAPARASTPHTTPKPLVRVDADAAPPAAEPTAGKIWFAMMPPEGLKAQLEEKKVLLIVVGSLLPLGAVWGPIAFLGTKFDMEWALPVIVWSLIFPVWLAPMVMFANLNRPDVDVGEKK